MTPPLPREEIIALAEKRIAALRAKKDRRAKGEADRLQENVDRLRASA